MMNDHKLTAFFSDVSVQSSRPVTKFTEEFDFMAMNEKFKKDEVWGHLGKNNKSHSKDKEGDGGDSDEGSEEEDDAELSRVEIKVLELDF